MTLPEFLTQDADSYVHISGHRVSLQDLVFYYKEGYSPEALLEAFPTLSLALIHKVIAYYLENSGEVDAYVSQCEAEMERQRGIRRQRVATDLSCSVVLAACPTHKRW